MSSLRLSDTCANEYDALILQAAEVMSIFSSLRPRKLDYSRNGHCRFLLWVLNYLYFELFAEMKRGHNNITGSETIYIRSRKYAIARRSIPYALLCTKSHVGFCKFAQACRRQVETCGCLWQIFRRRWGADLWKETHLSVFVLYGIIYLLRAIKRNARWAKIYEVRSCIEHFAKHWLVKRSNRMPMSYCRGRRPCLYDAGNVALLPTNRLEIIDSTAFILAREVDGLGVPYEHRLRRWLKSHQQKLIYFRCTYPRSKSYFFNQPQAL